MYSSDCKYKQLKYSERVVESITDFINGLYRTFIEKDRYLSFLGGLGVTLKISFFAVLLGVLIGVIVAVVKFSATRNKVLKPLDWICNLYINIIRGTPVYVQLLIMNGIVLTAVKNQISIAVITFGINSGAYVAEIIRAGILSVDKGQLEAGSSLGLSYTTVMKSIIMPQAIKNILPALGNEFITLIKETAIAGVLAVNDLTKAAERVQGVTFDFFTPLISVAAIYLVIVLGLTKLLKVFERRLAASDNH